MKLTKTKLKQIIREEIQKLNEGKNFPVLKPVDIGKQKKKLKKADLQVFARISK